MRGLHPSLTYANLVSTLALFIALGGAGAYAADQLAEKSVGAPQLRPAAVTADKIRKNAVTAPKIKALAVKQGKLANGSVTASKMSAAAIATGSLAQTAVTTEKIAPEAVTGDKVAEGTLSQVPSAARADFATSAESANPPAFAAVDFEGNTNPSLSKGLSAADVRRKSEGIYCIIVPDFNPRGAQVTPRNINDGAVTAYVTLGGTVPCPAPQVEVRTYKGPLTSEAFYISLYR
jgi:hypothetical protein